MSTPEPGALASEPTKAGLQSLMPGVTPISTHDRLALRAAASLSANCPQRGCDCGLFDLAARDQLDLFGRESG